MIEMLCQSLFVVYWLTLLMIGCSPNDTTPVHSCTGQEVQNSRLSDSVFIEGCDSIPCVLRRNSTAVVEIILFPNDDVHQLINHVFVRMVSIPVPYLGIDGTSACDHIFLLADRKRKTCPLKRHQRYIYRNHLEIKQVYPKGTIILHWTLKDNQTNDIITCFELPLKIT